VLASELAFHAWLVHSEMASKLQFLHGMATLLLASNGLWMTTEFIVILPHKPLVDVLLANFFFLGAAGGKQMKKSIAKKDANYLPVQAY
jgi:hypothetical protein